MKVTRQEANELARIIGALTLAAGRASLDSRGPSTNKPIVAEIDALERLAASVELEYIDEIRKRSDAIDKLAALNRVRPLTEREREIGALGAEMMGTALATVLIETIERSTLSDDQKIAVVESVVLRATPARVVALAMGELSKVV